MGKYCYNHNHDDVLRKDDGKMLIIMTLHVNDRLEYGNM